MLVIIWLHHSYINKCWEWQGRTNFGYGLFVSGNIQHRANRLAAYFHNGWNFTDKHICHSCDNTRCCNPNHLFLGTDADNVNDKVKKGRQARGITSIHAKLTESQIADIKKEYANGNSQAAIGRKYNLHQTTIHYIVKNKSWKHLNPQTVNQ